ncbi:lysosome-associated membrane glycoprotein 1 [Ambystoma mexicanum]|uniref:lysosome-associated membrane glycoprotein 1 n=1 Tax=Ambystoma mexicanum TaxID=8296 RepID=UPI0037E9089A
MAIGSFRRWALATLILGCLQSSFAVLFEVKDSANKSCILADLAIQFFVPYSESASKEEIRNFTLPDNATVHRNSTCGNVNGSAPLLTVAFGSQQLFTMHFNRTSTEYQVVELQFIYNLSDRALFPSGNGTLEVVSLKTGIGAAINTTYRCFHEDQINMGPVNITLHNIKIEAYLPNNNFSAKETVCSKDDTPSTTAVPTTNSTVTPPTPPAPPTPSVGTYNVSSMNGTCLLMSSGLQLNITYLSKNNKTLADVFDLVPSEVVSQGNCTPFPTISLILKQATLSLTFDQNATSNIFYLRSVSVNKTLPADAQETHFSTTNGSTFYLKATVGKSYKCKSKQTLQITTDFSINTVDLQVQAYRIDGGKFGAVEECQLDENSMLVPIIVGAALAGLVLIVLIAYLIGRKRSHAGYQTI